MDILGQLRKLIEITFRSGTHNITIKGADGTIPGTDAPTQDLEIQISDSLDQKQAMTTNSNTQTFTNKTIDSEFNPITLDSCETESIRIDTADSNVDLRINTSDPAVNLTVNSADSNTFITLDADVTDTSISNIDSDNIKDGGIATIDIADDAVTAAKINLDVAGNGLGQNVDDGCLEVNVDTVTIEINEDVLRVKEDGITANEIDEGAVGTLQLATNAVTTENIVDGNVTDAKIDTVSASKVTGQFPELLIADGSTTITAGAMTVPDGAVYINITASDGSLSSITRGTNTNKIYYLQNDTIAEILVVNNFGPVGSKIETGTGGDINWPPGTTLVVFDDGVQHNIIGGSGAGKVSGLEIASINSDLATAQITTHYLVDTAANPITVNLPAGSVLSTTDQKVAKIRFTDATDSFVTNNLTIVPNTGEQIDGFIPDESLIVDATGAGVELTWDSTLTPARWTLSVDGVSGPVEVLQNSTLGEDQNLTTADIGTGAVKTGSINITTGDQSGTGDSGDINLTTGSAGGTQGNITLNSKKLTNNVEYRTTDLQNLPASTTEFYGTNYYWENTDFEYVFWESLINPNNTQVNIRGGVGHQSGNNCDLDIKATSTQARVLLAAEENASGKYCNISLLSTPPNANLLLQSTDNISFKNGSEGTAGHVWTSVNAFGGGEWKAPAAWSTSVVSASLAASNYDEIITDGTVGITITLPDPTTVGTRIRVIDGGGVNNWSVNNVTVTTNLPAQEINFDPSDLNLDVAGGWVELVSNGTGWLILST